MQNKTIRVITYVLLGLVIVGVIGFVAYFTNGFKSDFKTFYISVDGKDIMESDGGYMVSNDKPLEIKVKYVFSAGSNQKKEYSVKVVPNTIDGRDFTFSDGKEEKSFQSVENITSGFDIKKTESGFTVSPKGNTVEEVLKVVYPNGKFDNVNEKGYENMFTLVVTSYDGKANVKLNFSLSSKVSGVMLDKEGILF